MSPRERGALTAALRAADEDDERATVAAAADCGSADPRRCAADKWLTALWDRMSADQNTDGLKFLDEQDIAATVTPYRAESA